MKACAAATDAKASSGALSTLVQREIKRLPGLRFSPGFDALGGPVDDRSTSRDGQELGSPQGCLAATCPFPGAVVDPARRALFGS